MTTSRVSFDSWATLNDTIMGGTSQAGCRLTPEGLLLEGEVVADGGVVGGGASECVDGEASAEGEGGGAVV